MTETPAPEVDAPASSADLLAASELPATTAGPAASDPKLPPFRGD